MVRLYTRRRISWFGQMEATPLRVLIADDYYAFRQGLKVMLSFEPDITVIAEATNGRQTVELALKHKPDAVVMDLSMGSVSGIEVIRQIVSQLPGTKVLVLSGHSEQRLIEEALASGAHGYLSKSSSLRDVCVGLREIRKGYSFVKVGRAAGAVESQI